MFKENKKKQGAGSREQGVQLYLIKTKNNSR